MADIDRGTGRIEGVAAALDIANLDTDQIMPNRAKIAAFAQRHWAQQPWVRDVARRTKARLDRR